MKHFLKIATNINVIPLLSALQRRPELWNADRARQDFSKSPHVHVDDILLRFSDTSAANIGNELVCANTDAFARLPQARPLVNGLMTQVEGSILGRVMVTRLPPGKRITPHADTEGAYANYFKRYHVVLQSLAGCTFRANDDQVQMVAGEVWQFDAHAMHEVVNGSADDRIHLIVDIRSD